MSVTGCVCKCFKQKGTVKVCSTITLFILYFLDVFEFPLIDDKQKHRIYSFRHVGIMLIDPDVLHCKWIGDNGQDR